MKEQFVKVSVAALWTSLESPRHLDMPALENPVRLEGWLDSMTYEQRLALCEDNLIQSQLLYGEKVLVVEEAGEWAKVLVPSQPSKKDERGYPGWIPKCQLGEMASAKTESFAVVTACKTNLLDEAKEETLTLSYQTRLPVVSVDEDLVQVDTPHGMGYLNNKNITICQSENELRPSSGKDIVLSAERFLGLPYLWGGMSAFGYDCSGFAYNMLRAHGITVPRDAGDQANRGKEVDLDKLEPGDLLFFAFEEGKGFIHHVGIYYGAGKMIHAPKTGKSVEVISLAGSAYEPELCCARRYWE